MRIQNLRISLWVGAYTSENSFLMTLYLIIWYVPKVMVSSEFDIWVLRSKLIDK